VYIYEVLVYYYIRMKNDNISRRSANYQFTIDPTSEADKLRVKHLRAATALKNKWRKTANYPTRLEVAVKPRIGVDSKFKAFYARDGGHLYWNSRRGNYKMEHATRADVYVYTRRIDPWGDNNY